MKSTMKKLVVTWFVLCVIGVLLPNVTVKAETEGDYEYTILEDGTVEITKYTGTATTLTIPDKLGGRDVTRIADMAFWVKVEVSPGYYEDASTVTTVHFPETLTYIGNWNFYQLKSIHIPANVTYIGSRAFGMDHVESITVDENNIVYDSRDNCNAIIRESFDSESNQNEIELVSGCNNSVIPEGVTRIGADAFSACSFESIEIPDTVTEIGYCAFYGSGLKKINLPDSVKIIYGCAFMNCKGLTEIVMPNSIQEIWDWAFEGCSNLESINIPEGVTTIGGEAFAGCTKLEEIVIPASVTEIGAAAFVDCSSIVVDADNPVYDSRDNCNAVILKEGMYEYWDEPVSDFLIAGCKNTTIPSSVTAIGARAFMDCSGLTSIVIPENVTFIDDAAFSGCDGLTSVTIPASVEDIGEDVFADCPADMVVYTEPDSYAAQWAEGTKYAKGYILPEEKCKVKVLSSDAASPTVSYTEATDISATAITVPNQVKIGEVTYKVVEIADNAFSNCTALKEVVLPEMLEKIGSEAFAGLTDEEDKASLKVTIPEALEDVSNIGIEKISNIEYIIIYVVDGGKAENYFQNFGNITVTAYPPQQPSTEQKTDVKQETPAESQKPQVGKKYTVKGLIYKVASSKNVTIVGASKKKITKVTIPAKVKILGTSFKVTAVGKKAFKKYTKLKTVVIGSNVKTIGDEAFMKCTKLKNVTIGKNVQTIGKKAFYGDKKVKKIDIKGTKLKKIGKKAMKGVPSQTIMVPKKTSDKLKKKYKKLVNNAL